MSLSKLLARLLPKSPPVVASNTPTALGEPPSELAAALRDGSCVLFAGEELSRQCSLPVWSYLMLGMGEYMADTRRIPKSDGDKLREIHRNKAFGHLEKVVRVLLDEYPEVLPEYLDKVYRRPVLMPPPHERLKTLPFAGVITPMLDSVATRLIPNAVTIVPGESAAADARFVLRLRGDLNRFETVRFWPEQAEKEARQACVCAATNRTVVFAGTSGEEIERWFEAPAGGPHFALMPNGKSIDAKSTSKYGIRTLTYDAATSQPLVEFLKKLDIAARKDHTESVDSAR